MTQGLKEFADNLKAEKHLLQQLIYRNHNQHSSSQLFSYLKSTARVLKLITTERIHAAAGKCESALRSSGQAKLSQIDISEIADTHILLFAVVNMLAEAMTSTLKSSDLLRTLLRKKLFLPLYTMLLAISARVFCCLSELHQHFYIQCNALSSQLQHIALLNPRLSKQIATHLVNPEAKYSALVAKILERMTPASESSSTTDVAHNHDIVPKTEKTLKESRNVSTNSLVSQTSQSDLTAQDNVETVAADLGQAMQADSDLEDAGLVIGNTTMSKGSTLGTLTPSALRSNLSTTHLSRTPTAAIGPSNVTTSTVKPTTSSSNTDFDSLFSPSHTTSDTPAKKKQKTEILVKSKSSSDLISVKYKDNKSVGEKKKDKSGNSGSSKEKKDKGKGGTKRKSESADDIDDIFGF